MNIRPVAVASLLLLGFSADLLAVTAAPIETVVTQPDGTKITVVARGDEHRSWIETRGGHSVVKVNDAWFYARKNNNGKLESSGTAVGQLSPGQLQNMPRHVAPDLNAAAFDIPFVRKLPAAVNRPDGILAQTVSIPHTQYVLTVLVEYTDISTTYSDASFVALMYGASDSVRDFFLENSYDGFTIEPPTESFGTPNDGLIRVSRPETHPNQGNNVGISRLEARSIVALTDSFIDYSSYDFDASGSVESDELSIVIILAGYEASYGGLGVALTPNVWGHKADFTNDLTLDGVALDPYTMFGEAHATSIGNRHQATIGIMSHELGHLMLGLPDLYDVDQSSEGIGDWGLMASGSWNRTGTWVGDSPAHLSAWSKTITRLTVPEDILADQSGVNLASMHGTPAAKRIWIDNYRTREYFLVENRQQSGYDAGLPGDGLLIWHVDDFKTTNADENSKWVDVEAADGLVQMDNNINKGDAGDPYPGSTNNPDFDDTSTPDSSSQGGLATLIGVNNISNSSATMTADFLSRAAGYNDHVRYDEDGRGSNGGFGQNFAWIGMEVENTTSSTELDGIDVYVNDSTSAVIDIYFYTSFAGGQPSGLIYSETGIAAVPGWNRLMLTTPQSFPVGSERGLVVKLTNNSFVFPISFDNSGNPSGRSYIDSNGSGPFAPMCPGLLCGDLNLVALLGGIDTVLPVVNSISTSESSPSNANSISFDVIFSEEVTNFNQANDLVITHSGTAHSGINISGSGASYTVTLNNITGSGSFTLKVSTASDVQDAAGNMLGSTVTSTPMAIDNIAPAISVGAPSAALTTEGPVSYIVSYTGASGVSLASNNITLNKTSTANGTIGVSGAGTASRTVTVSNITGNGTLGISIDSGTASDDAGNTAPGSSPSNTFAVDNAAPSATTITPAATGPLNTGSMSFAMEFSENVNGFNNADDLNIVHSGTSHSGVNVTGSGSSYTVNVTGIAGEGSFTVQVKAGSGVQDAAGNSLVSSVTSAAVHIDNIPPFISISPPSVNSTATGPVTYTVSYSGADSVTLANANVTLNTSGTATGTINVSGSGLSSRTVTISNISGLGSLSISIGVATASDDAGNTAPPAGPSQAVTIAIEEMLFSNSFETD